MDLHATDQDRRRDRGQLMDEFEMDAALLFCTEARSEN
jgi:hypothetical protein